MSAYERLKARNITLPQLDPPVAAFVPFVRTGNLVFISGHIAKKDGKPWTGKLGADLTTSEGKQAAQSIANRPAGNVASRRRRSEQSPPHRQASGASEQHTHIHRAASRRQRRFRTICRYFRRTRCPRPQRLRYRSDSPRLLRRNRTNRRTIKVEAGLQPGFSYPRLCDISANSALGVILSPAVSTPAAVSPASACALAA